jgi:hypothetical protein
VSFASDCDHLPSLSQSLICLTPPPPPPLLSCFLLSQIRKKTLPPPLCPRIR